MSKLFKQICKLIYFLVSLAKVGIR